jgi:lysine-ketoglutarate reductase/saccharopine dehydrogenase-like protein (TIGR00300 family)
VVCGAGGVSVQAPETAGKKDDFSFMSSGVSSERRVERIVEELAWEMRRIKARGGRTVVVAGPVVVHTGGGAHLAEIVRLGFVQALLTGNALPVHDMELSMFGTSLGVDLRRGMGVRHGHQHHLRAINSVRKAGSIRAAVEQGVVDGGIMYECVRAGVEMVLAGSIRDDGPLPDTLMDLCEAQAAYAKALEGAELILMLSSMLHAIGTGNMTKAGVKLVCVDISPAVVTKLADRGSVESVGVVTDVGLFLNLLAQRLRRAQSTPPRSPV